MGRIRVSGWAIDPDTADPIYVWVTVDGVGQHLYANIDRPDFLTAYPDYGSNHYFQGQLAAPSGTHTVCVTGHNVGPGSHKELGCQTVTLSASPTGNHESSRAVSGGIEVKGWAFDPDTTDPIYVWVTLDGVGRHLYANVNRPDVAAAYPGYGPNHGFFGFLEASPGTHSVCVTAHNVGPGTHTPLGSPCQLATLPGESR